ncbi:MAG: tRNA pseudouridine(13) synthase TruD [Anaerolineae bacterium]
MDDLAQRLDWSVPYLTAELPGVGGVLRDEIEDFIVDEVPAYEPCGDGEHTYFRIEKRNIATMEVVKRIARQLDIAPRRLSYAGLKDARAIARQTLSAHFVPPEQIEKLELDNVRVLWVSRHRNKLRPGHLRGNRFTLRIREVVPEAEGRAAAISEVLSARGVPNAYGPQRFGNRGDNHIVGYHLVRDDYGALQAMGIRRPSRRMFQFFISALQSALFNQVVARRIQAETLDTVIAGDVARKEDTGGIFTVEDVEAERPRAAAWEISATGPIYGYKMMEAQEAARDLEAGVLAEAGLTLEDFRPVRARGLRRPLRYNPEGLTWEMEPEGNLVVSFFAPKGSFATMLLRELMKAESGEVTVDPEDHLT